MARSAFPSAISFDVDTVDEAGAVRPRRRGPAAAHGRWEVGGDGEELLEEGEKGAGRVGRGGRNWEGRVF